MEGSSPVSQHPESRKPGRREEYKYKYWGIPKEAVSEEAASLFELLASKLNCAILDALIDETPYGLTQAELIELFREADLRYSKTAVSTSLKDLRLIGAVVRDRGSRTAIYYIGDPIELGQILYHAERYCQKRHDRAKHQTRNRAIRHSIRVQLAEMQRREEEDGESDEASSDE
jgi:hypothetical protein